MSSQTIARRLAAPSGRGHVPVLCRLSGYWLLVPACALVCGLLVYPLLDDLRLSLTDAQDYAGDGHFVGLANYAQILGDAGFWQAARTTLFLVLTTAAAEVLVGLAVALLLWRRSLLRPLLFVSVFLPWVFPSGFAHFIWYWILLPPFHTFYTLRALEARFWLESVFGEQAWQVLSFALVNVWRGSALIGLVLLAGLWSVPRDLLDTGRLDTASPFRFFWSVVAPLVRRFLVLSGLLAVTVTYLDYLAIFLESNGRITMPTLGTLIYQAGLVAGRTGYAAALSLTQLPVVLVLILVGFTLIEPGDSQRRVPEAATAEWPTLSTPPTWRQDSRLRARVSSASAGLGRAAWLLRALACLVLAGFYLLPIYYTTVQSVKSQLDFLIGPIGQPFWAYRVDLEDGILDTLRNPVFWRTARTTLIVFGSVIVVGLVTALLAGYALARLRLPGAEWLARLLFATYFVPQLAVLVPLLQVYRGVGLENTLPGISLLYLTLAIPFPIWLFYVHFRGMDSEAEDHARLDGTRLQVFLGVVLPRTWPVIAAASVFVIGMLASDLLYGRIFTLTGDTRTLPIVMGSLVYDPDNWADANTAIVAGALPLLLTSLALAPAYLAGLRTAFSQD
jgi:multiple sugar transport system permease protein